MLPGRMNEKVKNVSTKLAKFYGTNLVGTVVDTLVLWLFSHILRKTYAGTYILAPLISFECSVLVNFVLSFFFVWKDRVSSHTPRTFFKKYLQYNLSCSGVFLVKMGFLLLVERLSGWHVVFCNLIALCISGVLNFVINEFVIFRKKKA